MRSRIRIDLVPLLLLAAVAGLLLAGPSAFGGSGDVDNPDHFELGDGVDPDVPGVGDIEGEVQLQGPDWTDLFDADGNLRDVRDEYGGDVHGRTRLHREVIAAVRAAVGTDFPILLRLGAAAGAGGVRPVVG